MLSYRIYRASRRQPARIITPFACRFGSIFLPINSEFEKNVSIDYLGHLKIADLRIATGGIRTKTEGTENR